jgi:predicted phosphodiesterase
MPDKISDAPFEVFLIGDTGDISRTKPDIVMEMLCAHANEAERSAIIFLGDNVYPRGLPPKGTILRSNAEITLNKHRDALKDYQGKVIFISGNHDWNQSRKDGYQYVMRQEEYIKKLFPGKNSFLPAKGCPGPAEINITDHLTLIFINTQWWMQKGFRPIGKDCGCRVSSEEEFFEQLNALIAKNKDKHILIAGHHPVYSYAIHGGRFKLKHHIFPLTLFDKNAYIPLPVIGSLLPLYRKWLGSRDDMAHPWYRHLRKRLKEVFATHPNLIYASGHEHNLQYITKNDDHFIVSGSGSKTKYVIQTGKHLQFGIKSKGFFKLRFETDRSVFASAWVIDTEKKINKGKLAFEQQII